MPDEPNPPEPDPQQDPQNITIPVKDQEPPPPARQPRSGSEPQAFTAEDVERIRAEERARVQAEQQRADQLQNELAQYRAQEEERQKAEAKAQKDAERAAKKKEEEEMELRDLMAKRDQEWEVKLAEERAEREKALAILDQERRHAQLQNYLSQRMMEVGDDIAPQLRQLVGGNTQEEIDASLAQLAKISNEMLEENARYLNGMNAQRRTASVTSPPIGPPDMSGSATTKTYTPDELKALTPEEYAAIREDLHRAASAQYKNR